MNDFIVIGGGIAGLSVAAALAEHGQVTLLEAEPSLGYHSSARSAALTEKNYGAPSVCALNEASFDALDAGGYLSPRGLLIVGTNSEEEAFAADLDTMQAERISLEEAQRMVPILATDKIGAAGYHAEAFDIDTDLLMQDLGRRLRQLGGSVHLAEKVTAVSKSAFGWQVMGTTRMFDAKVVVNAAGAWADQIAVMAGVAPLSIIAYRRSMARIPAPAGHDVSRWPMFFGVGESWYAKPDAGALLVSPAEEDPVAPHDAWGDDMRIAEGLDRYSAVVTEPVKRVMTTWGGLRSFAPDRTLVLGPDPDVPDFVWCAGQGGYGFQTTPAAAKLVASLVTGAPSGLPDHVVVALQPDRLR